MNPVQKKSTRRLMAEMATQPIALPLAENGEAGPPPIAFTAHESLRFAFSIEFRSTPDDPHGRGVVDDLIAFMRSRAISVRDVHLAIPTTRLMTPAAIARRADMFARAAAARERSIESRRPMESRISSDHVDAGRGDDHHRDTPGRTG